MICFDFTPTRAMLLLENFLQNRMVDTDALYGYNTDRTLQSLFYPPILFGPPIRAHASARASGNGLH